MAAPIGGMDMRAATDTGIHDATGTDARHSPGAMMKLFGLLWSPAFLLPRARPGRCLCTHSSFRCRAAALP
jgi:hypothetical protein